MELNIQFHLIFLLMPLYYNQNLLFVSKLNLRSFRHEPYRLHTYLRLLVRTHNIHTPLKTAVALEHKQVKMKSFIQSIIYIPALFLNF